MTENRSKKITLSAIKTLKTGAVLWDGQLKGFGARRQRSAIVYFVKCRCAGRQRWITIGEHGSPWSLEDARVEALRLLLEVERGGDPVAAKKLADAEMSMAQLIDEFLSRHGPKLKAKTLEEYERICRKVLVPKLGERRSSEDLRGPIGKLHADMKGTPRMANLTLAVLSKVLGWAEDQGWRAEGTNPCRKIGKYREERRERFLTAEELSALGEVLRSRETAGSENPFVIAAVRLLLLTGARLQEILTLKWSFVNRERRLLMLPDSKTGRKVVRLNAGALEVLDGLPRVQGNPYVIVGGLGDGHLVNLQKPWRRIRGEAGLDDVRLHDLRHSFASVGVGMGGSLPMIGRLLGHTQPQTTQRYAHLEDQPLEKLNEDVGHAIWERLQGGAKG